MIDTIITRMRRNELLSMLDMLERELDAELAKVESGLETLHLQYRGRT